ncbi:MAG TPA: SprT family zinc-dependent metalloprotease [Candidatus Saccharimonadales bacterium]|nr:SprT family zinc-dependent metalloprotease [Candidatus Saccharimonadales bacterium]
MKNLVINDEEFGAITVRFNSRARRIIMRLNTNGSLLITAPHRRYLPDVERFIESSRDRLRTQRIQQKSDMVIFRDGQLIGKHHTLSLLRADVPSVQSRTSESKVLVKYPGWLEAESKEVQDVVTAAVKKALRRQAKLLLPLYVADRAKQRGLGYETVRVNSAKSRWGSCTTNRRISLNLWLLMLPDELIDYVVCHELCHLIHPNHGEEFWQEVASFVPDYLAKRRLLKTYHPLG